MLLLLKKLKVPKNRLKGTQNKKDVASFKKVKGTQK
jgi:hypothetical protein